MIKKPLKEAAKNLLITYAFVLLAIAALLPLYYSSYQNARKLIEWQTRSQATEGFARIVNTLSAINSQMSNLYNNKQVLRIAISDDTSRQRHMNMYFYNNNSGKYMRDDSILDIFIQFRTNNVLLMHQRSVVDKQAAYGPVFYYADMTYEQWQQRLTENRLFWPAQNVYAADELEECITYNWYNAAHLSSNIMISSLIRTQYIKDNLGYDEDMNEFIYLTSHGNTMLFSDGYMGSAPLVQPQDGTVSVHGTDYTLTVLKDDSLGLTAVLGTPETVYSTAMRPVTQTFLFYIGIALTLTAGVTLAYGYYHYNSLTPLMTYLDTNNLLSGGRNLFEQIRAAFFTLDERGEVLRRDYRRALRQCRTLAFDHALSGLPLDEDERALLDKWSTLSGPYALLSISQIAGQSHLSPSACSAAIKNLAEGVWSQCHLHFISANRWICLIPSTGEMHRELELLCAQMLKELDASFLFGVSAVQENIDQLCLAGTQANHALMNATLEQRIKFYAPHSSSMCLLAPFAQYKNLQEQLQAGNREKVNVLLAFFRQHILSPELNSWQKQNIIYNLQCVLHATFNDDTLDFVGMPSDCTASLQSRIEEIETTAMRLCDRLEQRRQSAGAVRVEQVLSYIDAHYRNSSLCLARLAQEFHMSESRISQYIKTYTGRNYTALLEEKRMQEAMRLLKQSDMTIDEIYAQVGYEYKNTFYKSFKRYYGTSPNKYRTADE